MNTLLLLTALAVPQHSLDLIDAAQVSAPLQMSYEATAEELQSQTGGNY